MKITALTREKMEQHINTLELKIEELKRSNDHLRMKIEEYTRGTYKQNQGHFKDIFENSPLAIMCTNREGVINACNNNATSLFGAPREKLIGFSYRSIIDKAMKEAIAATLKGEKSHFEGEYLTVSGNVLTNMYANFSPSYCNDGSISGVIGIFEDITLRVMIEKAREKSIDELREALAKSEKLSGCLPICASCKRIRDNNGVWSQIEIYIMEHSGVKFSHSVCPECVKKLYPGFSGNE